MLWVNHQGASQPKASVTDEPMNMTYETQWSTFSEFVYEYVSLRTLLEITNYLAYCDATSCNIKKSEKKKI